MSECDVLIIGCGPAGLSAAIFCGRANLSTTVIGIQEKSQAKLAMHIENYLGFPDGVDGPVLLDLATKQAKKFNVSFVRDEVVTAAAVQKEGKRIFIVKTSKGQDFTCRSLIVATGVPIKFSGIKNEALLINKGVHYCISCDGPIYKNKKLAVIGNGNHAAEDAVEALSYTKDIMIISNAPNLDFTDVYKSQLDKFGIATIVSKIKEFRGDKRLESVILEDGKEIVVDAIFMACGTAGALDFAANLGLEITDNMLVVDENSMTSMEGVFAAGNCAGRCRQIAKNVGDGCNAAINVIKYLKSREIYMDYVHDFSSKSTNETTEKQAAKSIEEVPRVEIRSGIKKKLRIGWFTFSCCEDSTIVLTEMLNDYYDKWKDIIDIRYLRALRKKNDMKDLDVAFVEGAISNEKAAQELMEIRKNCKKLVAVGACAITGMPSGQRNQFDEKRRREILPIIRAFDLSKDVLPVSKVVTVDDTVPGCPMTEAGFLNIVNKYVKEFGISAQL